jgi:hypothetical protein
MRQVFAYLDPGTGSMVLQVIVGGLAAVGVAGRYYWRRITGRAKPGQEEESEKAEAPSEAPTPGE